MLKIISFIKKRTEITDTVSALSKRITFKVKGCGRKLIRKLPVLFFALFLILQGLDISKDYATLLGIPLRDFAPAWNAFIAPFHLPLLVGFCAFTIGTIFIDKIGFPIPVAKFLFYLLTFIAIGLFSGLTGDNENKYVFLETSNWMIYLVLPFFVSLSSSSAQGQWRPWLAFLGLYSLIIISKVLLSFIIDFSIHITYLRVIVKGNFIFLAFFFTAFSFFVLTGRRIYWILMAIACGVLLLTGMRGYYFGTVIGFLYYLFVFPNTFIKINQRARLLLILFIAVTTVVVLMVITDLSLSNLAGFWGNTLQIGADYRIKEFNELISEFKENPFFGKGFGLVLFNFEGFEEGLAKPYLQELEWINLLAKTGLIGIVFIATAFVIILRWMKYVSKKIYSEKHQAILQGLSAGLVAMLSASFTNTLISSILFHVYVIATVGVTAGINAEAGRQRSALLT